MPRKPEVDFDFGQRLTFRVPVPPVGQGHAGTTEVDVYLFHPPIQPTSPERLTRLPWVLFLAPRSKTRRAVPEWVHDLCRSHNWPLVTLDSAPDVGAALVALLEGEESHLNWCLLATGPGAEADTGNDALDERYYFDFVPHGGLDPDRMVLLAPQPDGQTIARLWTEGQGAAWLKSVPDPALAPSADEQAAQISSLSKQLRLVLSLPGTKL